MNRTFIEHEGKIVDDPRFAHLMALSLDSKSDYRHGLIRAITSRTGDVQIKGYVDRSELYFVSGESLERFVVGERLVMKNEEAILDALGGSDWDCIGFEDPDIFYDDTSTLTHVYFTIPFRHKLQKKMRIHVGHAQGRDLGSLEMTMPVLQADAKGAESAKEVSIAPINSRGARFNLFEGASIENGLWYSTVRVGIAEEVGAPWQFGETIFHPKESGISWVSGHASPGPLLPRAFIDVGKNKLLGILNGREASREENGETLYGMFSVGLFIYDYERGKVEWVLPEPFIRDSEARTITFASQFVETGSGEGILFAHVDDSFVRAYTLFSEGIRALLP